jgi:hypothetical protein
MGTSSRNPKGCGPADPLRDNLVEPNGAIPDHKTLPIALNVLLAGRENLAANSQIEDFVEVGQKLQV